MTDTRDPLEKALDRACHEAQLGELRAEIERLQAALNDMLHCQDRPGTQAMIVQQLRDIYATHPIVMEAAAEIERLQAESDISDGLLADAKAEIERLRALSVNNAHSWDAIVKERNELRAETERLTALLRRHQVAAWCEDDSDLAVETRAALAGKEGP